LNWRIYLTGLLVVILLGLGGCVPGGSAPPTATTSAEQIPRLATLAAENSRLKTQIAAAPKETGSTQTEKRGEQILSTPTLAPTATPGRIANVVERAVNAVNPNKPTFLGLKVEDWINLLISLLIVILFATLVTSVTASMLKNFARRTKTKYDELFISGFKPYLRWLFFLVGMNLATERLQFLSAETKQWLAQMYFVFIIGLVIISIWKLMDNVGNWYEEKLDSEGKIEGREAIYLLVDRGGRFLLIIVGFLVIMKNLGFDISALLAALGIGGLALSLAAQDTIANMISGVIILMDSPFRVGDRIEFPGLDTWGDVVEIGLRTTKVRTRDNKMVIVPNSTISTNQIVNYSFPDPRYRIQTEIGVGYDSDLKVVREVISKALYEIDGLLKDKPVDVLFLEYGQVAMILRVRWWIESYQDTRRITDKVNEAMYKALVEAKIDMPGPMMTVELKDRKPGGAGR
jgi:MscS family membrane protein